MESEFSPAGNPSRVKAYGGWYESDLQQAPPEVRLLTGKRIPALANV
jgi:hypothetical protein